MSGVRCGGEFRTIFRTIPAPVAQWIEQRFPKPQVVCSIHAGGATDTRVSPDFVDPPIVWISRLFPTIPDITLVRRWSVRYIQDERRSPPEFVWFFTC